MTDSPEMLSYSVENQHVSLGSLVWNNQSKMPF